MSKFNQKALVAALALGISGIAGAAQVQTDQGLRNQYTHAWELTGATNPANRTAQNGAVIGYAVQAGDDVVLRAQDIKVTVNVVGARFASLAPNVAQGDLAAAGVAISGTNSDTAVFTIERPAGNVFGTGTLFSLPAGGVSFTHIPATADGNISLIVTLTDPTTGAEIGKAAATVLTVNQATNITFAPTANATQVDVGATPARTAFVNATTGNAGFVDLGVIKPVLVDFNDVVTGTQGASALGSGVAANTSTANLFALAPTADRMNLTVTAADGAAFRPRATGGTTYTSSASIRYQAAAITAGGTTTPNNCAFNSGAPFLPTSDNTSEYTAVVTMDADMIANGVRICAQPNGSDPIASQTFQFLAQLDLAATNTRDPNAVSGQLAPLTLNGVNTTVYHVNPGNNADQQSYLRISNTSGLAGLFVISGTNDAGVRSPTTANFSLAPGQSILLTSAELESGNAAKGVSGGLGASQGKWRVNVDAQVPTMQVQNFLRNVNSGGMVNTNVNVQD